MGTGRGGELQEAVSDGLSRCSAWRGREGSVRRWIAVAFLVRIARTDAERRDASEDVLLDRGRRPDRSWFGRGVVAGSGGFEGRRAGVGRGLVTVEGPLFAGGKSLSSDGSMVAATELDLWEEMDADARGGVGISGAGGDECAGEVMQLTGLVMLDWRGRGVGSDVREHLERRSSRDELTCFTRCTATRGAALRDSLAALAKETESKDTGGATRLRKMRWMFR